MCSDRNRSAARLPDALGRVRCGARARDLMRLPSVLRPDDPAEHLLAAFEGGRLRAVAVASPDGRLIGMVSGMDLLHALLPPWVREDPILARVLEEDAAWALRRRLEGKRVKSVVNVGGQPSVGPEDTLVQVAMVMVQSGDPAVPVVADGRILGVVTLDGLLRALLQDPRVLIPGRPAIRPLDLP